MTILALLLPILASAPAAAGAGPLRRLSFEKIAGYSPQSQVTDHCAIDLDQAAMEAQLARGTEESFGLAMRIYKEGGYSGSYAQVTLAEPIEGRITEGEQVMGRNAAGEQVAGSVYQDYEGPVDVIKVRYDTTDLQKSYVGCQVGGLLEEDVNDRRCFAGEGELTVGKREHAYVYIPELDNNNGRTISGFSAEARESMREGCRGCPYKDFIYFYDYYGVDDYANEWILAAFKGTRTQFKNGNADFSLYDLDGREEGVKLATAYMNIFMKVIHEFEDALNDCMQGCVNCNREQVHAWDEGVCFYTGSIEGQDGMTENGVLLHQLADNRCQDFKTCNVDGTSLKGVSKLNHDLFDLFAVGQHQLQSGNCPGARDTVRKIVDKMYVALIQGAIKAAYRVDKLQGAEKEAAQGATFAAAVLPRVYAADPAAAQAIYANLRVAAPSTNAFAVKAAFESVYDDMGLTCADVGGLWNRGSKDYYVGMEPCVMTLDAKSAEEAAFGGNTLAVILGCTFGALFAVAAAMVLYMRSREIQGEPVFQASTLGGKQMT